MKEELLGELRWFNCASEDDLPSAKREERFLSWAMRTRRPKLDVDAKLDYLIYKHEITSSNAEHKEA